MDTGRLIKTILLELTIDNLKLEDELERTINSNIDLTIKTEKIKDLLTKMVLIDNSITKFNGLMGNNNLITQDDGNKT